MAQNLFCFVYCMCLYIFLQLLYGVLCPRSCQGLWSIEMSIIIIIIITIIVIICVVVRCLVVNCPSPTALCSFLMLVEPKLTVTGCQQPFLHCQKQ